MSKQKYTDDEIIGAILAGAALTKQVITPELGYFGGSKRPKTTGKCCAVGAGVLYANLDRKKMSSNDVLKVFAKHYGVSIAYAAGVSDGFEMGRWDIWAEASIEEDRETVDYARGWAVGAAVRCSLDEVADPVRVALGMEDA